MRTIITFVVCVSIAFFVNAQDVNKQKEKIYSLIRSFDLLTEKNRKNIIDYLDDFYKTINSNSQVKNIFIEQARKM